MNVNHYNDLWVEKYRPKTLADVLLSEEHREYFKKIKNDVPHILFYGSPGIGKTTLAKVIVNDILKCQYLYINASDENGIDTIRNKVITFSQTRSFDGKKKIVILDEADGLSGESLRILRNVMDDYTETTRFILTANYVNKIIEPVRSRCALFKLMPEVTDYISHSVKILKQENIKVNSDQTKGTFVEFLTDRFPDM